MTAAGLDPFEVLGLDRGRDLTDDDVRNAWRRIAAATHPDRPDGGDAGLFAAAAGAYCELRTGWGRGEARASLADAQNGRRRRTTLRLAVHVAAAVAVIALALLAAGRGPAGPALTIGVLTWLAASLRRLTRG